MANGVLNNNRVANYSESERVVGRWIDNKPLYERTIHRTYDGTQSVFPTGTPVNITLPELADDFEYALITNLQFKRSATFINIPYVYDFTQFYDLRVYFYGLSHATSAVPYPHLYFAAIGTLWQQASDLWVTIRYTKSTDQANT